MEQGRSQSLRLSQSNKLTTRDLRETLGKLPPQALDLEEAILGALMIETKSIEQVPFLKPQHFYDERHKEIFRAVLDLKAQSIQPDMRMVVSRLREVGKIELVGNAYYIAELTSKVSSSANIQHHARVVVEMAMKRTLIELATRVHEQAYDDTTDVFKLLDEHKADIEFLEERETKSDGPERVRQLWEKYGVTTEPSRPEPLIALFGTVVCTVGNISLLVGKKKSRKSLLTVQLLFEFLKSKAHTAYEVIVFDTEQEEYDVWQTRDRIYRMTNQYVSAFCLRGLSPKERREFISNTVKHWPHKLRICVLDGIRDCMSNINDPDETTEVMSWLMKMNVETGVHFINILHLNKTDDNARGHIGTELLNKAEVTIQVDYQKETGFSLVKCESSRRKPFDEFLFTHDVNGLPEIIGKPVAKDNVESNAELDALSAVFEGEALKSKEVLEQLRSHLQIGLNKAKQKLAQYVKRGWVVKSGKDRDPNTTYKLVAATPIAKVRSEPEQTSLFNSVKPVEPPPPPPPPDPDGEDCPFLEL